MHAVCTTPLRVEQNWEERDKNNYAMGQNNYFSNNTDKAAGFQLTYSKLRQGKYSYHERRFSFRGSVYDVTELVGKAEVESEIRTCGRSTGSQGSLLQLDGSQVLVQSVKEKRHFCH
ncbi:hypothetical protein CEXT_171701 [Caerostris extrusa]|uniref:Uncharacterized protein n=1 Tax=Caerostris extrusa TaxID=172846 RepID=A0AAV4V4U6_CAEEX|nr:hypothetical protein CEXT_171701 [Caerostris extrusa]